MGKCSTISHNLLQIINHFSTYFTISLNISEIMAISASVGQWCIGNAFPKIIIA